MSDKTPRGTQAWVARISEQELPALCSTIKTIEKMSLDDTSSLAQLGQAVLHDHALTSAVLKVANSATYMGRMPVTTVSRAAVVLGLNTIKNICITAKLLNSLLKNKKLTPQVHERLLKLMAQSFHGAMLTRMMLQEYGDEVQEEAFIAALLNQFGETAFWSMGGTLTVELDQTIRDKKLIRPQQVNTLVYERLGTTFHQMSLGLASNWNLGSVLISSLKDPELRTPELRSVSLGVRLSQVLANPQHSRAESDRLFAEMAQLMSLDDSALRARVEHCTEQTGELLHSYGVGMLARYIHQDSSQAFDDAPVDEAMSDQELQLRILRELAFLPNENADFNLVVQTAIEGIHRGIHMEHTLVLLFSRDHSRLLPRFISAPDADRVKQDFRINLTDESNVFSRVIELREPVWVSDISEPEWHQYLTASVRRVVSHSGFFIAPIFLGKRCVGVFYADRAAQTQAGQAVLNQNDFMAFTLFTQQTNLCLSLIQQSK